MFVFRKLIKYKKVYLPSLNHILNRKIMESNKSLLMNKAMVWGLYVALALIIVTIIFWANDSMFSTAAVYISQAISIAGIVMVTISYKKSINESTPFTYGNALGLGVATMFFASIILALFTFILYKFIDPSLTDKMIQFTEETYLKSGLSEDMVEKMIDTSKKMMTPSLISMSQAFNIIFYGLLFSLITSIFLRKKQKNGFDSAMNEIDNEE